VFREAEDGKVLSYCRSHGCKIEDIAKGLGLSKMDFSPRAKRTAAKTKSAKQANDKAKASRDAKAVKAIAKAKAILEASCPVKPRHPYAKRKKIRLPKSVREISQADAARILGYGPKCNGEPLQGRLIVVPVFVKGTMSTCEFIDEDGRKSAVAGGVKRAGYWTTQPLPASTNKKLTVVIGEGMATVVSVSMSTGHVGVTALSCVNLLAVGQMLRARYPRAKLVFIADLGIGEVKCAEAARAVDGFVMTPDFGALP
jgi:putative DNA primase/helicase